MESQHAVLVTYGEPPTPSFAAQLVYSWRILLGLTRTVAPIPKPLIPLIALSRAHGRRRMWRESAYASPLEAITRLQADRLREALEAMDQDTTWVTHVAYEFRRPFVPEILTSIPPDEPVWVVPMYAADSAFTHALARDAVAASLASTPRAARVRVLGPLEAQDLARISAEHVMRHLEDEPGWHGERVALMLAAHGTLLEPTRPMETGLAETTRLCDALRERMAPEFGLVSNGWLNHTRGGRWTVPAIEVALTDARSKGFSRMAYFPYGFLADNAETQLEGQVALRAQPGLEARAVPCLNDARPLAEAIARMITKSH